MKIKKGMAIPLVLIFATIMGAVSIFLLRNTKHGNAQNITSMDQLQSYFIARAGVEHAMVKVKYLNRELYDAMCMQQGRSSLFDYSQISDADINANRPYKAISEYNPGPIFLYMAGEKTPNGVNTDMGTLSSPRVASSTWINTFKADLGSDYYIDSKIAGTTSGAKYNQVLQISNIENQVKSLGNPKIKDNKIFNSASYLVSDIKVAASKVEEDKSKKVDNTYIIEFTVKSAFVSARNNDYNYEIKRTLQVSRDIVKK